MESGDRWGDGERERDEREMEIYGKRWREMEGDDRGQIGSDEEMESVGGER